VTHPTLPPKDDDDAFLSFLLTPSPREGKELFPHGMAAAVGYFLVGGLLQK
jgi:hypothetical protein